MGVSTGAMQAGADKNVLAANLSNELADKGFLLTTADDLIEKWLTAAHQNSHNFLEGPMHV